MRLCVFGLLATCLLLSGCATKRSGWSATGRALARPDVWVPAVAGGVILAGGWDRDISDAIAGSETGPLERDIHDRQTYGRISDALLYTAPALWAVPVGLNHRCANPRYPNCGCTYASTSKRIWTNLGATGATFVGGQAWKELRGRQRPDEPDNPDEDDSFPSGHTYITSVSATLARHEIGRLPISQRRKQWASAAVTAWPVATAFLRVRAKRHYASDVLVGYAYGSFMGHLANEVFLAPTDPLIPTLRSSREGRGRRFTLGFTMDL